MRRRAEGEWFFPLQKKQEVESEEKSEKSSFFDRDTTNLYNRGSRHGKRSHSFLERSLDPCHFSPTHFFLPCCP